MGISANLDLREEGGIRSQSSKSHRGIAIVHVTRSDSCVAEFYFPKIKISKNREIDYVHLAQLHNNGLTSELLISRLRNKRENEK